MKSLTDLRVGDRVIYVKESETGYRRELPARVTGFTDRGVSFTIIETQDFTIPWGDDGRYIADPRSMQAFGPVVEDAPLEGTVPELE